MSLIFGCKTVSTSLMGLKERNKNTGDVPTHLCGGGGRLEVFTGTDSDGGGHTGLLFCGDTGGSTFRQNISERQPMTQTPGIPRGVSAIRVEQGAGLRSTHWKLTG